MAPISPPLPDLQIALFDRLNNVRRVYLLDSLLATVGRVETDVIDRQLAATAPKKSLRTLASWGLRGELLFPVPCLLEANPHLLGYYRLLLGFSQKEFYRKEFGLSSFKSMEEKGALNSPNRSRLQELCTALASSSQHLIKGLHRLDARSIHELTLLTLGPQLRGGILNLLGSQATRRVFDLIESIVHPSVTSSTDTTITLTNAAGRIVIIEFASDPDVRIRQHLPSGAPHNLVAIEIKGGTDISNIHNRIGEAEKSHQKARKAGFTECWTIVGVSALDTTLAKRESPSTDRFFFLSKILDVGTPESAEFREELLARVGIQD